MFQGQNGAPGQIFRIGPLHCVAELTGAINDTATTSRSPITPDHMVQNGPGDPFRQEFGAIVARTKRNPGFKKRERKDECL